MLLFLSADPQELALFYPYWRGRDSLASAIAAIWRRMKLTKATLAVMLEKQPDIKPGPSTLRDLPARKGSRPKTLRGPLHIQCSGHGDRKYIDQLVRDVLSWPHVEALPDSSNPPTTIPIRFEENAATLNSTPFITAREFARVLLGASTIYLALPLVCAHWAIVRGWAEPHYLSSFGFMPAGAVVVYAPKDRQQLSVCYALFHAAYHSALAMNSLPAGTTLSGIKTCLFPERLTNAET